MLFSLCLQTCCHIGSQSKRHPIFFFVFQINWLWSYDKIIYLYFVKIEISLYHTNFAETHSHAWLVTLQNTFIMFITKKKRKLFAKISCPQDIDMDNTQPPIIMKTQNLIKCKLILLPLLLHYGNWCLNKPLHHIFREWYTRMTVINVYELKMCAKLMYISLCNLWKFIYIYWFHLKWLLHCQFWTKLRFCCRYYKNC